MTRETAGARRRQNRPAETSKGGVRFIPVRMGTLDRIYRERVRDWTEAGGALYKRAQAYKESYRKRICPTCSEGQQKRRRCVRYVVDGRQLRSCGHMDAACGKKFRKEFDAHMDCHPAMFRARMARDGAV